MYKRAGVRDRACNIGTRRRRITRTVAAVTSVCAVGLGAATLIAAPASADSTSDSTSTSASAAPSDSASTSPSTSQSVSLFPTCDGQETAAPFAPWGDNNPYFPMPGGTFESGSTGWTLSGAAIVAGNESYFVHDPADTQSLSLAGDAQAVSPETCVDLGDYSVRMFVRSSRRPGSTLHILATVDDPLTGLSLSIGYDIDSGAGTSTWGPTDQLLIPNLLGGLLDTANLTLTFTTSGPATWYIDDVYVDPFKSH
jgi:hypothetical protein